MSVSRRSAAFMDSIASFMRMNTESAWTRLHGQPGVADFVFGNPHDMPLSGFVQALQQAIIPQDKDWFAYRNSESPQQAIIAELLRSWRGLPFKADDVLLTTGAFAGLSVSLNALVDPGDEVIFISPPWFFYEGLILAIGAVPVRVKARADNFDLDIDAIEKVITAKTRAIIVNSPNNPTGRIYPKETLRALASLLEERSRRNGRPIYLLSDEAYSRIIFDGRSYPSPTEFYANTVLIYTYGKTLLTPGQRLGYLALPPGMPEKMQVRNALFGAQVYCGYAFPNALLQHALADLDRLSIDVEHLQEKRDRLGGELRRMGYQFEMPEGTFYLLVRSPIEDDWEFIERLAMHKILCMPGTVVEMPGHFRISLTANDGMIDMSLPGFEAALHETRRDHG